MKSMDKLKDMLCEELDRFARKDDLSTGSLDAIHKLTDSIKNLDKIEMLEAYDDEYSERGTSRRSYAAYDGGGRGGSYDGSYDGSYASPGRGRGSNARRDSMGRYARDGYSSRYSRDDEKEHLTMQIEEMMKTADSEDERQALRKAMKALENA